MVGSGCRLLCRTGLTCSIYRQIAEIFLIFHYLSHSQMERIPILLRQIDLISHFRMIFFQKISPGIRCFIQQSQIITGSAVGNRGNISGQTYRSITVTALADGGTHWVLGRYIRRILADLYPGLIGQTV